jgi:hypothetical protein
VPVHHFTAEDVCGSLLAAGLLPLFLWIPGYALAWLGDLFGFRRRTSAFRAVLSLPLSIAVCPIATYWLGHFLSMGAVWAFYGAMALVFAAAHRRRRPCVPRGMAVFGAIALVWLGIALFALVDVQVGHRLYYPTNSYDYSLRASWTHAISATGIPPQSPQFLPAHPVALRYHYFWLMMCSLPNQLAPGWISARQAEISATFWCGLGLMALVALCLRLLVVNRETPLRRRVLAGTLLLGITGLDLIPGLLLLALYLRGAIAFVLPSLEMWNEYVDWFLHSTIWAPHAVGALIAAFTGFLLVGQAGQTGSRRAVAVYGVAGGAALASTAGVSIWVAFVFGAFLAVWTAICAWRKWWKETAALLVAGSASLVLAGPYLYELVGPGAGAAAHGGPIEVTVRAFSLAALVPGWHGMGGWTRLIVVNGSLLPLNYFLEFGFFFLVGMLRLRQYRKGGAAMTRADLACVTLLGTSALICTFLKSTMGFNDLGWRGFLPAQFVLLLWAADAWTARGAALPPGAKRLLAVFVMVGAAGTAYDLAITRAYPVLADAGVLPEVDWMSPDRHFGARNYAQREAYEWAREETPENAVVQFNPEVRVQDTPAMLYGDRRAMAADTTCKTLFGGDPAQCATIVTRLEGLYADGGRAVPAGLGDACRDLPVDVFVAKDTDRVWGEPGSWVWRERPVLANGYVRLFRCGR